ncbi:MAG: Hsp20/alpha crystallin family protein [Bacteroidota bacterium]
MSDERQSEDIFENLKEGFSSFGKKVSDFVDDVMSSDTLQRGISIRADIYQHEDQYVIELELAGVPKEDVDLKIYEGVLIVRGIKKIPEHAEAHVYQKRERRFGEFRRDFELPTGAELDGIKAKFENGLLRIVFPHKVANTGEEIDID